MSAGSLFIAGFGVESVFLVARFLAKQTIEIPAITPHSKKRPTNDKTKIITMPRALFEESVVSSDATTVALV